MQTYRARPLDATKILTRRELAVVLNDLKRKAPRSKNTRLNLALFRLACCCGLRASEIAKLQVGDVRMLGVRMDDRICQRLNCWSLRPLFDDRRRHMMCIAPPKYVAHAGLCYLPKLPQPISQMG